MADENRERARVRVELYTPRGGVHSADRPISDSLTELMLHCERTKDKHDLMRVIEGIAEAGAHAVMEVASSLLSRLRRSG